MMTEPHAPPSAAEICVEIERLEQAVYWRKLCVTGQEDAERSIRFARALLAAPMDAQLVQVARALLADLRHLVRWHDQLGKADIARAEATIARATTLALPPCGEIEQLRSALIECCNAVGGMAGPNVSNAFLLLVPGEVRAVVAALRGAAVERQHG